MNPIHYGPYTARELCPGIWNIEQDFVRSYLVLGRKQAMLVDTCDADADLPGLVAQITSLPVTVVQTHCDHDHIGSSQRFDQVLMHPSEFALLRETSGKPLSPRPVREGEVIDLGGRQFAVLLIPGHTPGSIALLDTQARLLFSGDSVKDDTVYMFGPGRDLTAYIDSLERLYVMREQFDAILPCHGTTPVSAALIPGLIEGAKLLAAGQLEGREDGSGLPCKLYTHGTASFYYAPPHRKHTSEDA